MVNEEDRPVLSPEEQIAENIAQDRRSAEYIICRTVPYGHVTTFSTSQLHPGVVVMQDSGGDPIVLNPESLSNLVSWLNSVVNGTVGFPVLPRRCYTCGQIKHVEGCDEIAFDTTVS